MRKIELTSPYWFYVIQIVILAVVYFGAAKLGLALASVKGIVTLVWPPAGIALAALLLFGYRLWPGITLGAFLANVSAGASLAAVGISLGNTLEALTGAYLLHRCLDFRNALERLRDVLGLVGLAAVLSPMVSATLGTASLGLSGILPWSAYGSTWWVWWLGDALGILLVAPVLLTWGTDYHLDWQLPRLLEAATLGASLIIVSQIVFSGWLTSYLATTAPLSFTLFPFLVWAALRFGQRGAVTTTLIGTGIAVWGMAHGFGPFVLETVHFSLVFLSGFIGTTAVTAMLLAAAITERQQIEEALAEEHNLLRTLIDNLPDSIYVKDTAGRHLLVNQAMVQGTGGLTLEQILGKTDLELYPPEVAGQWYTDDLAVIQSGKSLLNQEEPAVDETGLKSWDLTTKVPFYDGHGKVIGLVGITRDITARKRIEQALQESENHFRQLAESLPQLVWTCEPDGSCDYLSRQWVQYTGVPEAEQLGFGWLAQLHPADREPTITAWNTAVAAGSDFQVEFRIRRHDGVYGWFDTRAVRLRDNEGRTVKWFGSNTDISDRQQAEEALRLSEERFAKAFRASPDGISISRLTDGRIIEVNDRWTHLFGYSREEAIGQTAGELKLWFNQAQRQGVVSLIEQQGFVRELEVELRRKSGEIFQGSLSIEKIVIAGELCVLSITRDITDRKQAEEQLKQTLAELTRSNTELEQFAYIASHDLQEPLRMVISYTQLLARRYQGKLDADANDFIAFAVDGAERMQRLIQDLLAYSRVGRRGKELRPTSSEDLLKQALANLQLALQESQAVVSHDPLPTVLADETQLLQLFQNLIGNALKFRAEKPPQVHISAEPKAQEWLFSVRDNGIGLEPQHAERIFVIFQRLHHRTDYAGTGIGLAICKRIVERHRGRIWVESQPGQGATFYFTLSGVNSAE